MARETVRTGTGINVTGLKPFIRACRKSSRIAAVRLREEMRAAGTIVAEEAKNRAGEHSQTIPPTIKVRVRNLTVMVEAGQGVPLAALYEVGNAGGGHPGSFRHPVWGHDVFVEQTGYPFLTPAVNAKQLEVQTAVLKVADEIAEVLSHGR